MNRNNIHKIVREKIGKEITSISSLSGGSISSAYKAILSDGNFVFLKISPQFPDMFIKEANGLKELHKAKTIRIPNVLFTDNEILILEYLPVSSPSNRKKFFEEFGKQFAQLHRYTSPTFGFIEDNYIGSTPQKNTPQSNSWREFYWNERLLFQFHLAERNGYADSDLRKAFSYLEQHLNDIIPDDGETPALLHGDLWSGNYLCLENDIPAIIDPAVYYGHREADLGMTLLFGGFGDSFYDSYNESYPLNKGWEFRMEIYKLYHLFNHLNLFGEGYYGQVVETMRRLT
jgi:protein-ribulosamine 3-kinase